MWLIFVGIIVLIYLVSSNRQPDTPEEENPMGRLTSVKFTKLVKYGEILPMADAYRMPDIRFNGTPSKLYTLIMLDIDAPNPDNPYEADYLHWSILNIQAGQPIESGYTMAEYSGPNPPIGTHRYWIQLYEQNGKIETSDLEIPKESEERIKWNLDQFVEIHQLKKKGDFIFKVKSGII